MTDLRQLSDAVDRASERGIGWCLATLYRADGSSYRRPGACMVVAADGSRAGAISGGCLEAEVAEHALRAVEHGFPSAIILNDDLEPGHEGFGTGCGGRLHLVLEPVRSGRGPLADLAAHAASREPFVHVLVVVPLSGVPRLWRHVCGPNALLSSTGLPAPVASRIAEELRSVQAERRTRTLTIESAEDTHHVLLEYVEPRVRLVVVGDGYDVAPIVRLAGELGWETVVVGRRSLEELQAAFPHAATVRFAMHPEDALEGLAIDAATAVVLASHNFERDRVALEHAIDSPAFYIGVLGPRRRTERMGMQFDSRVHAPLGLDIGAETPTEIALALIAEIQATRRNTDGGRLRDRSGPIHRPVAAGIAREESAEMET